MTVPTLNVTRKQQWDADSCGLAVAYMLITQIQKNFSASYARMRRLAGVTLKDLDLYGTRIDQIGTAIKKALPKSRFQVWFIENCSTALLALIVNFLKIPVGVSLQGLFQATNQHTETLRRLKGKVTEEGHYVIVVYVDIIGGVVWLVDPAAGYEELRAISLSLFEASWCDYDELPTWNKKKRNYSGRRKEHKTERVIFFVTPVEDTWPLTWGGCPTSEYLSLLS